MLRLVARACIRRTANVERTRFHLHRLFLNPGSHPIGDLKGGKVAAAIGATSIRTYEFGQKHSWREGRDSSVLDKS